MQVGIIQNSCLFASASGQGWVQAFKYSNTKSAVDHLPSLGDMMIILSLYLLLWHRAFPMRSSLVNCLQLVRHLANSFMSHNLLSLAVKCVNARNGSRSWIESRLLPLTLRICIVPWKQMNMRNGEEWLKCSCLLVLKRKYIEIYLDLSGILFLHWRLFRG